MVVLSLAMRVRRTPKGYEISAPWLDAPVSAATWEEAYNLARAARLCP